jgi:hypothetical protein
VSSLIIIDTTLLLLSKLLLLSFNLNELLLRLMILKLNNKNTLQNKLHYGVINLNNNSFNLNNDGILKIFSLEINNDIRPESRIITYICKMKAPIDVWI